MDPSKCRRPLAQKHGGDPSRSYALCLRVFAMGDHNACDVAQAVHEGVLEHGGALMQEPLRYGRPLPPGRLLQGVYLDDLLVLYRTLRLAAAGPGPDDDLIAKARAAYLDAGLEANIPKRFERQVDFKAWGAQVRGGRGSLASPTESRVAVAHLLDLLLEVGFVTKKILETVCGLLAYAFGFRREFLAILQESYRIGAAMPPQKWTPICVVLGDELREARLALPWAVVDLRAP